jgi:hypothetical protein
METVVAYCLKWHLGSSSAFREVLVDSLSELLDVELVCGDPWSRVGLPPDRPLVFCQILPPRHVIDSGRRIVWIPMWDNAVQYAEHWWRTLPANVSIVAFSDAVAARASAAGVETLHLRYFPEPPAESASWGNGLTLLHWNRTGLAGPDFLARLCAAIGANRLLYRNRLDPGAPEALGYELPARLGETVVERIEPGTRAEYLACLDRANVFLAPRAVEGIGLTFLEAFGRSCAVLARDAPTMNEYVVHRTTGYLFGRSDGAVPEAEPEPEQRPLGTAGRLRWKLFGPPPISQPAPSFALSPDRHWDDLAGIDLQAVGAAARIAHERGRTEWVASLPRLASFLTGR